MIKMPSIETNELWETIENDDKKKLQAQLRDFDDVWLTVFTWLRYEKATQLMTGAICIGFGKTNTFTKDVEGGVLMHEKKNFYIVGFLKYFVGFFEITTRHLSDNWQNGWRSLSYIHFYSKFTVNWF